MPPKKNVPRRRQNRYGRKIGKVVVDTLLLHIFLPPPRQSFALKKDEKKLTFFKIVYTGGESEKIFNK